MQTELARCNVVVSDQSVRNLRSTGIVHSNVSFVADLKERLPTGDEIPANALRSYYVDYHLAQRMTP
jgi:hypothetical protein